MPIQYHWVPAYSFTMPPSGGLASRRGIDSVEMWAMSTSPASKAISAVLWSSMTMNFTSAMPGGVPGHRGLGSSV